MSSKLQISGPIPLKQKPPPTTFQRFKANPTHFVGNWLNAHQPPIEPMRPEFPEIAQPKDENENQITLVCISDTHNATPSSIPSGDVLLHAGDLTNKGTFEELQTQLTWLNTLPHRHKIVISGNHDTLLDEKFITNHPERVAPEDIHRRDQLDWGDITYLNNTSIKLLIRGRIITIYGSPMTPQCGTFAFQYLPIRDVWRNTIPEGTDIVLTHGPPKGYLDEGGKGCNWLLRELWRVKPRLVVCGHIHEGRGRKDMAWDAVQSGYDFGGFLKVIIMGIAVCWWWISKEVIGKSRIGRTAIVNAAIREGSSAANIVEI